ncbi:hypothetical protein HX109_15385 [Galbibacter sp. BG1]|uniref:hypothetical protein n=1 Tax=Galbibacter sp. BG1 TaxID=1170699 RepID=UPI0015C16BE2|nr:hypothetical protein [Galbibacter sp. BG1]QLE02882.1 hypothetical protein HX109_15385 [Galbibacter sp. BG1]
MKPVNEIEFLGEKYTYAFNYSCFLMYAKKHNIDKVDDVSKDIANAIGGSGNNLTFDALEKIGDLVYFSIKAANRQIDLQFDNEDVLNEFFEKPEKLERFTSNFVDSQVGEQQAKAKNATGGKQKAGK